jgi:hypothetical protein
MEKLSSFPFLYRILTSAGVGFAALLFAVFVVGGLWENPADFNSSLALQSVEKILRFLGNYSWLLVPTFVFATALGEALLFLSEIFLLYPFFRFVYLPFGINTQNRCIERVSVRCSIKKINDLFKKLNLKKNEEKEFITIKAFEKLPPEEFFLRVEVHYNLSRLAAFFAVSTLLVLFIGLFILLPVWEVLIVSIVLFALLHFIPCFFFILSMTVSMFLPPIAAFYFKRFSTIITPTVKIGLMLIILSTIFFTFFFILALHQRFLANRLLKFFEQS